MDKNLRIPGTYIIRFETADVVPAPFSHYYAVKLKIDSETAISVDFKLQYTDRADISEDEIYNEGFTLDDDYAYLGKLPAIWIKEFGQILESSKMIRKREESEFEDFIEVEMEEDGQRVNIYPVDKERWTYFLQEIMQAIFETGGKENPFELIYLEIGRDARTEIRLNASFAKKIFTVSKNGSAPRPLEWSQLQKIMDTVYRADFVADNALTSKPVNPGTYLNAGDNLWYQMGVAILETSNKSKDLSKIDALFTRLSTEI